MKPAVETPFDSINERKKEREREREREREIERVLLILILNPKLHETC